jgi:LAS superfamily LD-carboxypeptidase LdcB
MPTAKKSGRLEYATSKNIFYHTDTLVDDASISRFVSRRIALTERSYAPDDLLSISGTSIDQAGRAVYLRSEAADALSRMARDFERRFSSPLTVISGYRSADYQQRLWDLGKCRDSLCAPPGHSEHQLGLAIDVFDATTAWDYQTNQRYRTYISWMQKNAHLYGWNQSYQRGMDLDGYEIEPWHWRYLGIDLATRLYTLGWNYTEYVEFQRFLSAHR